MSVNKEVLETLRTALSSHVDSTRVDEALGEMVKSSTVAYRSDGKTLRSVTIAGREWFNMDCAAETFADTRPDFKAPKEMPKKQSELPINVRAAMAFGLTQKEAELAADLDDDSMPAQRARLRLHHDDLERGLMLRSKTEELQRLERAATKAEPPAEFRSAEQLLAWGLANR